ncbi:FAD-binding domain-containing protein [Paucibacter sp. Y2R2-4]|uniref:FAD-binding domain-containing protein n=1 Tax=Paucibacter sp. Y2R2-4 TaxID=2893553 RepID=UPI0021E4EDC3|nr:FAD-binding domain-containing protein [Paucibacter sp. Y2R2-4]MCV2351255.1 deoxyribodipyrimidine photolyase [Paucibacter sp. Y2R2-4]
MTMRFEGNLAAAQARIEAVRPAAYAGSRNFLNGAVSGLSPYITHGLVSLPQVLAGVLARGDLDLQHKWVFELGWRAYFRHVWQHRGEEIFHSLHAGPLPDSAYTTTLPDDIRQGRTGLPVVDQAVRCLYATGMLHNHARMWLASYCVHVRKLHWRCAADWLYAHLLDGDLASNHLSWQWVAGTGSRKPYLFNAANVARYAPAEWHSPGSVIDASYDTLDQLARDDFAVSAAAEEGVSALLGVSEPMLSAAPPAAFGSAAADAAQVQGREVWLLHPWSLGELPPTLSPQTVVLMLWVKDFHQAWPWGENRWRFVGERLAELQARHSILQWSDDAAAIGQALAGAASVRSVMDLHLQPWLGQWADCEPASLLFPEVAVPQSSFFQWWARSTRGMRVASELLAAQQSPR